MQHVFVSIICNLFKYTLNIVIQYIVWFIKEWWKLYYEVNYLNIRNYTRENLEITATKYDSMHFLNTFEDTDAFLSYSNKIRPSVRNP